MGIERELHIASGCPEGRAGRELDLIDYLRVLYRRRLLIFVLAFVSGAAATVYAFTLPDIYRSSVVITPISRDGGSMIPVPGLLQNLSGLSMLQGQGPSTEAEISSLLSSNILKRKLIEGHGLMPVILYKRWDPSASSWRGGKAPGIWDGLRALEKMTAFRKSASEKTITITFEHPDPETATRLLGLMLEELNVHMSSEARRMADSNRRYLEEQLEGARDPFIRQKIYGLIAEQIEASMMAGAKENFAFKVTDPPMAPDIRSGPGRAKLIAGALVLAVLSGVFIAFFLEYVEKARGRS